MSLYYLDASAWVKRHVDEDGSDWMRRFWEQRLRLACSCIGPIEVLSAILRRAGTARSRADAVASHLLRDRDGFYEVNVSSRVLDVAEGMVRRHLLRAADAIHLASAALLREQLGESVCVVASDAELLVAAAAEGFAVMDPQLNPPVPAAQE